MPEIRTSEINETAWTGSNIDSKLTNNTTSIEQNCQSLSDAIKKLQSYQGKLRTERPTKIIPLGMTEQEKSMYAPGTRKQEEIYETWEFRGLNNNYVSCAAKIISEIDSLKKLLSDNSIQFTALEASAENLEIEYNKILAVASAAGIDVGSILLHETDAPTKSGESGDRTLKGEYSGIKEENFYLYENLEEGEYLDLEEGKGVETGTYFIVKHTKDGRKVKMKNISASTVEDWINKCYKAKQDKDGKNSENLNKTIIKGATAIGTGIISTSKQFLEKTKEQIRRIESVEKDEYGNTITTYKDGSRKIERKDGLIIEEPFTASQSKQQSNSKNLADKGFPSSTNPSNSQPKQVVKSIEKDESGNTITTNIDGSRKIERKDGLIIEEPFTASQSKQQSNSKNLADKGFPSSTNPSNSQPKQVVKSIEKDESGNTITTYTDGSREIERKDGLIIEEQFPASTDSSNSHPTSVEDQNAAKQKEVYGYSSLE